MGRVYRKKILALAKGFRGKGKNCYRVAKPRVYKALTYGYRDRKAAKRTARALWITRLNAASREYGLSYSHLMYGLAQGNVALDRKVLAELAVYEPESFHVVAGIAKEHAKKEWHANHERTQSLAL